MEVLGIGGDLEKMVASYSQGMKRKLRLVCAMAHRPRLLILDEPFSGLDPVAAILVRTLLREAASAGQGIITATHDLRGAAVYCDRVGVISNGELVAEGTPVDLQAAFGANSLEDVFVAATGLDSELAGLSETMLDAMRV